MCRKRSWIWEKYSSVGSGFWSSSTQMGKFQSTRPIEDDDRLLIFLEKEWSKNRMWRSSGVYQFNAKIWCCASCPLYARGCGMLEATAREKHPTLNGRHCARARCRQTGAQTDRTHVYCTVGGVHELRWKEYVSGSEGFRTLFLPYTHYNSAINTANYVLIIRIFLEVVPRVMCHATENVSKYGTNVTS